MTLPALKFHTVVPVGAGEAWSFGGYDFSNGLHLQTALKFDLEAGAVLMSKTVPFGFGHAPAVRLGNKAVIFGGMGMKAGAFRALQEIQMFDLATGTAAWETEVWPFGRYDVEAVQVSPTKALYLGGHAKDPATGEGWSTWHAGLVELSGGEFSFTDIEGVQSRAYATGHTISSSEAMFIGGWSYADVNVARRNVNTIEIVDTQGGARLFDKCLSHARRYHSSRKIGDKIYVMGGTTHDEKGRPPATTSIEEIDLASGTVRELAPMHHARYHAHTASVRKDGRDYLLIVGGQSDNGVAVTDVELYDVLAETSEIIDTTRPAVDHDRISVAEGDTLYVVGGATAAGSAFSHILKVTIAGATLARD